jgi:thiol-disulfide isomerase/thioredoxin
MNVPEITPQPPPVPPHGRPAPVLILFVIFPVLGIIAALVMALSEASRPQAVNSQPTLEAIVPQGRGLIDQPAPRFVLSGLDGQSYDLESLRGRVVFVNFWATWCVPCQRELPALQGFQERQGENGAVILAVNVNETPEQIQTYLDDNGISGLTILLDSSLDVYNAYDVRVMPTTYVIDPGGTIRYRHLGELRESDLDSYLEEFTTLP